MSLAVDVHARVGDFRLHACFEVPAGLTVVFGPSGSGKTRLLRLIAGLDTPIDGHITLDATTFTDRSRGTQLAVHDRRIGFVFQQPYLLPHRSVLANVALAVREGDRSVRRRAAHHWLARVDASALAERRPTELSGGQQQRVALARAVAGDARLLLLDEPFNALDLPVRRRLRRLVRELVDTTGVPTLFVTHDPEELTALADHVLRADYGNITALTDADAALRSLREIGDRPPRP